MLRRISMCMDWILDILLVKQLSKRILFVNNLFLYLLKVEELRFVQTRNHLL